MLQILNFIVVNLHFRKNIIRTPLLIYFGALLVQIAILLLSGVDQTLKGDINYLVNATAMLDGNYRDTFKPPLYSVILLLPGLIDHFGMSLYLIQIVAFSFSPVLIFFIVCKSGGSHLQAVTASVLAMFYPYYAFAWKQLMETGWSLILLLSVTLVWMHLRDSKRSVFYFFWGLLFGIYTLLRPNCFSILPVFFLADCVSFRIKVVTRYFFAATGCFVALIPWMLHTNHINGTISVTPKNSGYNLVIGHNPHTLDYLSVYGHVSLEDTLKDHPSLYVIDVEHSQPLDSENKALAVAFFNTHPFEEINIFFLKLKRYWDWRLEEDHPLSKQLAYTIPYFIVVLGAIGGLFIALRNRMRYSMVFLGIVFFYMLPFLIFFSSVRYRMPTDAFLIIFASITVERLVNLTIRSERIHHDSI